IKGLRLGMSKTEIEAKFGKLPLTDFKIANVAGKFPVSLAFYEDRLDELMFFFPSENFKKVREAVVAQYPKIKCTDSTVTSPKGEKFTQVNCKQEGLSGMLKLD